MSDFKKVFTIDEVLKYSPEELAKRIPAPLEEDEALVQAEIQDKQKRVKERLGSLARTYKSVTTDQKEAVGKTIKGIMKVIQDIERNEYINKSFKEMILESAMEITLQNIFDTLELKVIDDKYTSKNPFSPRYNLHELSNVEWAENDHKEEIDTSEAINDPQSTPNEREMLKTEKDLKDAQEITENTAKRHKEDKYTHEKYISNKYNKNTVKDPFLCDKATEADGMKYVGQLIEDQIAKMPKKELLKLARKLKIIGRSKMNKSQLISQILLRKRKEQKGK